MSTKPRTGRVREAYKFIEAHRKHFSVQQMCQVLEVAPSGFYDWLRDPLSKRAQEDARLLRLIRASFNASTAYTVPRECFSTFAKQVRRAANTGRRA